MENLHNRASDLVRLNLIIEDVFDKAREQHPELTDADLDRAIRLLTLDALYLIARGKH